MPGISLLSRAAALSFLALFSGCGLIYRDCWPAGCEIPLIVKNESNQSIKACAAEDASRCREIAFGSSLDIGGFSYLMGNSGEWIADIKLPWLVICNRTSRVNELGVPGKTFAPERIDGNAVVIVNQQMTQRFCGG